MQYIWRTNASLTWGVQRRQSHFRACFLCIRQHLKKPLRAKPVQKRVITPFNHFFLLECSCIPFSKLNRNRIVSEKKKKRKKCTRIHLKKKHLKSWVTVFPTKHSLVFPNNVIICCSSIEVPNTFQEYV